MSASNHINQEQLRALKALDFPSDNDDNYYTVGQIDPDISFDAHHYDALKDDIAKNGIKEPLEVRKGQLENGHHRAVAARDLGIEKIPIIEED
jgi:hypothetical protein